MKKALKWAFLIFPWLGMIYCAAQWLEHGILLSYTRMEAVSVVEEHDGLEKFLVERSKYDSDLHALNDLFDLGLIETATQEKWVRVPFGSIKLQHEDIVEVCFLGVGFEQKCNDFRLIRN